MMVQVTMTGQLAILMLIEALSDVLDCTVVSANTDGVTVRCHTDAVPEALAAVKQWESVTAFETERSDYRGLYSRDVNNYVAIKTDGSVKTKGVYGTGLPLQKNPVATICSRAVIDFLLYGTPTRLTVEQSEDIREFVCVRSVTSGALYRGEYVGEVVRWYYTADSDVMTVKVNGNKVPLTEGAKPCMVLPLGIPDDLDREWYIAKANEMLADLGLTKERIAS